MAEERMSELFEKLLGEVLRPDIGEAQNELGDRKSKLVHYTSAEAALKIIKSKQVWLRQTKLMNDFSEIKYGIDHISKIYDNSDATKKFQAFFDKISPTMKERFEEYYNANVANVEYRSYVLSLAEHEASENNLG